MANPAVIGFGVLIAAAIITAIIYFTVIKPVQDEESKVTVHERTTQTTVTKTEVTENPETGETEITQTRTPVVQKEVWLEFPGKDSDGNDIRRSSSRNIDQLKSECLAEPNCKAFNKNGWLKHTVAPKNKWKKYRPEQTTIYVNSNRHNVAQ